MPEEQESLERATTGALDSAIRARGQITQEWIGFAVKRIIGQLANAKVDGLARVTKRPRWEGLGPGARSRRAQAIASQGSTAAWAGMLKAERSKVLRARLNVTVAIQCDAKKRSGPFLVALRKIKSQRER
jgi:hypothetical protein